MLDSDELTIICSRCNLTKSAKNPMEFAVTIGKGMTKLYEEDFHDW